MRTEGAVGSKAILRRQGVGDESLCGATRAHGEEVGDGVFLRSVSPNNVGRLDLFCRSVQDWSEQYRPASYW